MMRPLFFLRKNFDIVISALGSWATFQAMDQGEKEGFPSMSLLPWGISPNTTA